MIYKVFTARFDGLCAVYAENVRYISAESEEEAKEIYKEAFKASRKKIYVERSDKKS